MKKFALVGCGIGNSLSPVLFGRAYPGFQYDLIDVRSFNAAIPLLEREYEAVNVTSPFKEEAFRYAVQRDGISERIGAVNILVGSGEGFCGFNSDYHAVVSLLRKYVGRGGSRVLVVGCGGAGRAAATACADCGFETILSNRTLEKARSFALEIGNLATAPLDEIPYLLDSCRAVIYTVPVPVPEAGAISSHPSIIKIEASYTAPSLSGDNYIGGKEWLLYQAIAGYGKMTGKEPDASSLITFLKNVNFMGY